MADISEHQADKSPKWQPKLTVGLLASEEKAFETRCNRSSCCSKHLRRRPGGARSGLLLRGDDSVWESLPRRRQPLPNKEEEERPWVRVRVRVRSLLRPVLLARVVNHPGRCLAESRGIV